MSASRKPARLVVVDAVRALALLGVLVMNLREMSGLGYLEREAWLAVQGALGSALDLALRVLMDEKSLSAFSFLFGLSFSLLLERKAGQGGFPALYLRRLLVLAGFGLLNIAFAFWGDILITYALLGLLLLPAARLSQRALLALSALLLFGTPLALALLGAAEPAPAQTAADVQALRAFAAPSFAAALHEGFRQYWGVAQGRHLIAWWDSLNILGLFLLGLWCGRRRLPHQLRAHRPLLRRVAALGLPLGLAAAVAWARLPPDSPLATLMLFNAPVLALSYLALAALLLDTPRGRPLRDLLAPAGRLALSNYLLYGVAGQLLFYGWGLDLIGRVSSLQVLLISLLIYGVLLLASRLWLRAFRIGPAEWLWRSLTYLRLEGLRRRPSAATGGAQTQRH